MKKILAAAAVIAPTLLLGAAAHAAANTSSDTASVSATIVRPITVTKTQDLAFGTIVRPSTAVTTTVSLTAAASPVRSVTGGDAIALASTTPTDAAFTVSGEGGALFNLTIPSSIVMTNTAGSGGTITVTTSNDAAGGCPATCQLSGTLGDVANGTLSFNVGGSFTITNTTNTGKYTGSVMATATYN